MIRRRYAAALLLLVACASAEVPANRYGLRVVPDVATYARLTQQDPELALVDVQSVDPTIRIDVRYATPNNFMHRPLYPVARVYLRRPAARALANVQRELAPRGLGLKVFDGYRPYRVTEAMWEQIHDADFVADPAKGSRHNRGAAVDLTLVNLATGEELSMPTGYDDFTPRAAQNFADVTAEVAANRQLLRDAMVRNGFEVFASEWWHFDFGGWQRFPLMDVPLEQLGGR